MQTFAWWNQVITIEGFNVFRFYCNAFADRDVTVGEGFFVNNEHYDVHRFHPPLVYGRRGTPDEGEGIALCKFTPK